MIRENVSKLTALKNIPNRVEEQVKVLPERLESLIRKGYNGADKYIHVFWELPLHQKVAAVSFGFAFASMAVLGYEVMFVVPGTEATRQLSASAFNAKYPLVWESLMAFIAGTAVGIEAGYYVPPEPK
jgi:hypothetical protein